MNHFDFEGELSSRGLEFKKSGDELNLRVCPFCSDNRYKCYVNRNTGLFHCFNCDEKGAWPKLASRIGAHSAVSIKPRIVDEEANRDKLEAVKNIWNNSIPLSDPEAEAGRKYLVNRGLKVDEQSQIRFCKELFFPEARKEYPALVFKVSSSTGVLTGLQRIFLEADGRKAELSPNKMALGTIKGNAIRFDEPGELLHLAEGPETSLAIRQSVCEPTWCAVSANFLEKMEIPDRVKTVFIWADKDRNNKGEESAQRLRDRLLEEGKRAYILLPEIDIPENCKGIDWLDVLNQSGEAALIAHYETNKTQNIEAPDSWPEPKELPGLYVPVPGLNPELLPKSIRGWLESIARNFNSSLEMVATPAFVALGSAIGARCCINMRQNSEWRVYPNLYGALVSRSASKKSPISDRVLKHLNNLSEKKYNEYQTKQENWEREAQIAGSKIKALQKKIGQLSIENGKDNEIEELSNKIREIQEDISASKPICIRYIAHDATREKLCELLKENPEGLLVERDELSGFLRSFEKTGREEDRQFYLEAWNGNKHNFSDRIGRGTSFAKNIMVSIFGGIQPTVLQRYFSEVIVDGSSDDGLLSRFQMMVHPEEPEEKFKIYDEKIDEKQEEEITELFRWLLEIGTYDKPIKLSFDDEAQKEFYGWEEALENRIRFDPDLTEVQRALLGKYPLLLGKLAIIIGLIRSREDGKEAKLIDSVTLNMAKGWVSYLELNANKIYAGTAHPEIESAQELLIKIKKGKIKNGDTPREIYRRGWRFLDDHKKLSPALVLLEEYGWLRTIELKPDRGGRTSEVIQLNPKIKQG